MDMPGNHRDGGIFSEDRIAGDAPVSTPAPTALDPVLFLPGLLCDQALWRRQIDALADRCAPFVADLTLDDSITAMIGISLIVYLRMRDTRKDSLIAED